MNALKTFGLLLIVAFTTACSASNTDDVVTPATNGALSALVDGQSFAASQPGSTYDKTTKRLTVAGGNMVHQVGFTLINFSGAGTIALGDVSTAGSTGSYTDVKTNTTFALKEGRTGTVTVTSFDGNTIQGTFSMKTYNTQQKKEIAVSNGSFKMPVITL